MGFVPYRGLLSSLLVFEDSSRVRIDRCYYWRFLTLRNYHTHTFRCNHAEGDVSDYAEAAVAKGFTLVGISDHTPLPDNRWLFMRMGVSALPAYVRAIEEAQVQYPELVILKSAECEWAKEYNDFFAEVLLGEYGFDYLILGCHFFLYQGGWLSSHVDITSPKRLVAYTDFLVESMQSGLFSFVAHPDLFGLSYLDWDENTAAASKDILRAAEEFKLPLEMNGYGLVDRRVRSKDGERTAYPWLPFWQLARDYDVQVVVNSDAHAPERIDQGLQEGVEMAKNLGLQLANLDHLARR